MKLLVDRLVVVPVLCRKGIVKKGKIPSDEKGSYLPDREEGSLCGSVELTAMSQMTHSRGVTTKNKSVFWQLSYHLDPCGMADHVGGRLNRHQFDSKKVFTIQIDKNLLSSSTRNGGT